MHQDSGFIRPFVDDVITKEKRFQKRSLSLQHLKHLKRVYVDARYTEHVDITEEELNWLANEVEKLKVLTEEVCQAKIESLQ